MVQQRTHQEQGRDVAKRATEMKGKWDGLRLCPRKQTGDIQPVKGRKEAVREVIKYRVSGLGKDACRTDLPGDTIHIPSIKLS